jgi:hypothetical protein
LNAIDWSNCADALDTVKTHSQRASDAATEAESAAHDLESASEDLDNCRRYPSTYDLAGDGCRSQKWDVDSAQDQVESAAEEAQGQLRRLRNALADAASDCEFNLSVPTPLPSLSRQGQCDRLRALRGQLSQQYLSDFCKTVMSAEECKTCLGF